MTKKINDNLNFLKETTQELMNLLGVKAQVEVASEEDILKVKIEAPEASGVLIGSHGATLSAIQSFLALSLRQKIGEWLVVRVDISDWQEKQNERLTALANQTASRAKATNEPQYLYNLTASQRRVVHLTLSKDPELETVSEGEGNERFLIIRPKLKK